jgi:hypothetical protein
MMPREEPEEKEAQKNNPEVAHFGSTSVEEAARPDSGVDFSFRGGGSVARQDSPKPASNGTALQLLQQAFGFASASESGPRENSPAFGASLVSAERQSSSKSTETSEKPAERVEAVRKEGASLEMVFTADGEDKVLVLYRRPFGANFGKRGSGPTKINKILSKSYAAELGAQPDWIVKSVGGENVAKWSFEDTQRAITKGLMTLPTQMGAAKGKGKDSSSAGEPAKGKGKGKDSSSADEPAKGKGKGKGKDSSQADWVAEDKGKDSSIADEPAKGKGKGKGKGKSKSKGK